MQSKRTLSILFLIIVLKASIMALVIHAGYIGLGPDEAQYWTWSQNLDWGYYSKPPGIAWIIRFGTILFGNTELGVRFGSLLMGTILPFTVYGLARQCRLRQDTAFWAAVIIALSPLGVLATFFAITDVGMALFWTLATLVITRGLAKGKAPHYYLIGLLILCGALFKWPIYLLWIFVWIACIAYPSFYSPHLFGGMALSLLALLPSIIWNAQHDWATFQHVWVIITGGHGNEGGITALAQGNFLNFIGAQVILLSPVFFVMFLVAVADIIRRFREIWPPLLFCGMTTLTILLTYSSFAFFQKMQGNWCDYIYPTAAVLAAWQGCERLGRGKLYLKLGTALSVLLVALTLTIPKLNFPIKSNPFKHNLGWGKLEHQLRKVGYDPDKHFLFGDKYQTTSILSFYGTGQHRAYFLNLHGARKNQFSYWPGMKEEQLGKDGIYVLPASAPHIERRLDPEEMEEILSDYFREVRFLGIKPLFFGGGEMDKAAMFFECIEYNGKEPPESDLY